MNFQLSSNSCPAAASMAVILASWSALADTDTTCPVSIPYAALRGQEAASPLRWFGSDSLAVNLPRDGIWLGTGPERELFNKLFWLVAGFEPGMEKQFSISGRMVDKDAPPMEPLVSGITNAYDADFGGWAVLTGLGFPATGCWEVTGSFKGQELTFVVRVVDKD